MPAVLKLDGYDLSWALRLGPDEGLEPAGQGFIDFQFSEVGAGDGDPLISIGEHNRELAYPVFLNPAKAGGGYANTKDGLHQLVRDLQRKIRALKVIEWADDGSTRSSFLDVRAARLDTEYHYRRGQHLWLKATLKAWTDTYAHTATMRSIGAATTGPTAFSPVASAITASGIDGDGPIDIDVTVSWSDRTATYQASGRLFTGFSVIDRPAPDLWYPPGTITVHGAITNGSPTLVGASGAIASQMVTINIGAVGLGGRFGLLSSGGAYNPATGGVRIIALARNRGATTAYIWAVNGDNPSGVIGPTQTLPASRSWRVLDLGVSYNDVTLRLGGGGAAIGATSLFDIGGFLSVPEARTVAIFAPIRAQQPVATSFFGGASAPLMTQAVGPTSTLGPVLSMRTYGRGNHPQLNLGASQLIQAFAVPDDGPQNHAGIGAEVRVRETFTYHR